MVGFPYSSGGARRAVTGWTKPGREIRRTMTMALKDGGAGRRCPGSPRRGGAWRGRAEARRRANRFDAAGCWKRGRIAAGHGRRLGSGPERAAGDARQWRRGTRFLPEIRRFAGFYQVDAGRYPEIEPLR
ncbi:hypothetical protein [Burkholderia stagnalis]|uniref:hypothetical protein n=2 Tax=Burkholderia stagnalis TaxID=1503054 RepID=UPI000F5659F4|nr:hypothetical protein [Burkholderia stagnalis]MDY7802135.1 hypothetical protein [Burkholderia stagnalis]